MKPVVQISLDLMRIDEALETARMALDAGVDWLEAGTPLILAEGLHGVRALHREFPGIPLVADLKTMDGGYLEAQMMAEAGASHVVVMARAHEETLLATVRAAREFGIKVMGDNLGCRDKVAASVRLESLGCDFVVHHVGYDERRGLASRGLPFPSPLDQLEQIVRAVRVPVQAVGGLSLEQAVQCPAYGAPLVVIGAPLAIDSERFRTAGGNIQELIRKICDAVHAYGDIPTLGDPGRFANENSKTNA
jgi:3-hexulose-6-phosphate synthase